MVEFATTTDAAVFGMLMTSEIIDFIVIVLSLVFRCMIKKLTSKSPVMLLMWITVGSFLNTFFFFETIWFRIPVLNTSLSLLPINYLGMYLNSVIPLQYINTQLRQMSTNQITVVPLQKWFSPRKTVDYWLKFHCCILPFYFTVCGVQWYFEIMDSNYRYIFIVSTDAFIVFINVYTLIGTFKFRKIFTAKHYKRLGNLQVVLFITNVLTMTICNLYYISIMLCTMAGIFPNDYSKIMPWLNAENFYYSTGMIVQATLVTLVIFQIKHIITKVQTETLNKIHDRNETMYL